MLEVHNTNIFKTFSVGISNQQDKETHITYLECSPEDGVELLIESEHTRNSAGHKIHYKKWLSRNNIICLRKMLEEAEKFYNELEHEEE